MYDGLGRCVKRTLNGVAALFAYDGWKPIAEFDAWNDFLAWNLYGPGEDEILLRQQGKYGYIRFQLDRHGNVAFLLNENAEVIEKYKYDAFGRPTVTDANGGNPRSWSYYGHCFLFQGREFIRELGIYDYRNRFYLPALGRFLQSDPMGFGAGDMNLFRYVGDDPIDESDPTGLIVDQQWKSACFWDSGNTSNDSWVEFNNRSQPGVAATKPISNQEEGMKIKITKSGNWGDQKSPDYLTDDPLYANGRPSGGKTNAELNDLKGNSDGSVTGDMYVHSRLKREYSGSNVDRREQEHPNGFKDLHKNLSSQVFMRMMKEKPTFTSPQQAADYKKAIVKDLFKDEKNRQKYWDQPHGKRDLGTYPPGPWNTGP